MRRRLLPLLLSLAACDGRLATIRLSEDARTTIPEGTVVEQLVGGLGFGGFTNLDLTSRSELANQGVEPGDIVEARMVVMELEAVEPSGADLSFLDDLAFFVDSPGLDEVRIAAQDTFPAGQATVEMVLDDVDIAPYVVSESLTITTDATGRRPDEETVVEARFTLAVGVTLQGAVNASKR